MRKLLFWHVAGLDLAMDGGSMQFGRRRPAGRAAGFLASMLVTSVSLAAPVLSADEGSDNARAAADAMTPTQQSPLPSRTLTRSTGTITVPEASTGNKNLDLLLDLQGRSGEELQRQASPASAAAASAAAAALADLRHRAAQRPAPDAGMSKPVLQPFEDPGPLEGNARSAQPQERREWTGLPAGAGGGSGFGGSVGAGNGDGGRESGASSHGSYDDDNLLRRLPREVLLFLRDNRYWLLGGLVVIGVIGAALKAYSRRI